MASNDTEIDDSNHLYKKKGFVLLGEINMCDL